jgi:hypothetical protein
MNLENKPVKPGTLARNARASRRADRQAAGPISGATISDWDSNQSDHEDDGVEDDPEDEDEDEEDISGLESQLGATIEPQTIKAEETQTEQNVQETTADTTEPQNPPPTNDEMASNANEALAAQLAILIARVDTLAAENARLRAGTPATVNTAATREGTAFSAATEFEPKGLAAKREFNTLEADHIYDPQLRAHAPDPTPFNNIDISFEAWVIELAAKFDTDGAMFANERTRINYAARFVTGEPKKAIESRLRSESRPYTKVAELIQVLQTAYRDPNLPNRARRELIEMKYNWKNTTMGEFIARFNGLAEDAGTALELLKQTLFDTLPPNINVHMGAQLRDPNVTFEQFCDHLQWHAHQAEENARVRMKCENESNSNRNNLTTGNYRGRGRGRHQNNDNGRRDGNSEKKGRSAPTGTGPYTKLTDRERADLMARGGCFRCREDGHVAKNCPRGGIQADNWRTGTTAPQATGVIPEDPETEVYAPNSCEELKE